MIKKVYAASWAYRRIFKADFPVRRYSEILASYKELVLFRRFGNYSDLVLRRQRRSRESVGATSKSQVQDSSCYNDGLLPHLWIVQERNRRLIRSVKLFAWFARAPSYCK